MIMHDTRSTPAQVGATCSHIYKDADKAHYCSYIQVPGLLETFYRGARTTDEILLCSGIFAYVLWWNLQQKELTALLRLAEAGQPLTPEQGYDALKRANRCVEVDRIMLQQGVILRSELLHHHRNINFRFASADTAQLEVFTDMAHQTRQLEQTLDAFRLQEGADEAASQHLLSSLKDLTLTHSDSFSTIQRDFRDLLWAMHEQPAARVVDFKEVVPVEQLLSFGQATLQKHHPQSVGDQAHTNDELTFITAHQAFEVWFPAVIHSIQEATRLLQLRQAQTWEAEALVRRIADIFSLFGRMIHIPQTMTSADYIEFRDQLQAGSGVESFQFRAIEISAGLRDSRYQKIMERMQLLTDDLRMLWDAPSLNAAFMETLADRGIIAAGDAAAEKAAKIAELLLPAGFANPNVDLTALAETLVRFEQNVELWRTDHIAMVTRMIGRKTGTGAATYAHLADSADPENPERMHFDSLPYLHNTLKYQKIFPALWDARDYLHDHSKS
jgi:tryptophan 2,3-dioxygenase